MMSIGNLAAQNGWAFLGTNTALQGTNTSLHGTNTALTSVAGTGGSTAPHSVAGTSTSGDLQSFLATLNQVLQQASGSISSTGQAAGSSAAQGVAGLESAFHRLIQDLAVNGSAGASAAQNASTSVQSTLQSQLANLKNLGKSAAGTLVHASA
jgi:hypothetical protein